MNRNILNLLCDPETQEPLTLSNVVEDADGQIEYGNLLTPSGRVFPIIRGIPRFVRHETNDESVESFGDQWNFFNYDDFKENWLRDTVKNTFGSVDSFRDKLIVDAGAGSGMQSAWMLESGASHVIALELSHAVDGVIYENLKKFDTNKWDIIQCSIDQPPFRRTSIQGIIICHNVIQHTPSVEATAGALFSLVSPGSEFVFNCYDLNDVGIIRKLRWNWYLFLRDFLKKRSFKFRLRYAKAMALLQFVPILGPLLGKSLTCAQTSRVRWSDFHRKYRECILNTFDAFGAHEYQHHKSDPEIRALVQRLQPNASKVLNMERYFLRPKPVAIGLRIFR